MKDINSAIEKLKSSSNEDEIIANLKTIIKSYNLDEYKDIINSNSYFSSLFTEIVPSVLEDIQIIKNEIIKERISILEKIEMEENHNKRIALKNLMYNCIFMLGQLEKKEKDLLSI